jgi:hypothetical protein
MQCYQIDAPKQAEGAESFGIQPARSSSLASKIFFLQKRLPQKGYPFLGQKPFLDRFLGEGA